MSISQSPNNGLRVVKDRSHYTAFWMPLHDRYMSSDGVYHVLNVTIGPRWLRTPSSRAVLRSIGKATCNNGNTELNHRETDRPLRSSFRDWTAEEMDHPRQVTEATLAHKVPNPVETAYRRTDLFGRRVGS